MKRVALIISVIIFVAYIVVSLVVLSRHGYLGEGYSLDEHRMQRVDSVINSAIAQDDFPGAVLCVVSRARDNESMGRILHLKAYGNRQVCSGRDTISREWIADTIAMTTDAVFLIRKMLLQTFGSVIPVC